MFMANDAPKMLQFFVPSIGVAPKWCSYLESITEELEETEQPAGFLKFFYVNKMNGVFVLKVVLIFFKNL